MKATSASRVRSTLLVSGGLLVFMAFVIYRSLHVASYQCTVCIDFHGQSACRKVEGPTEQDARMGATTNTCAFLASGVTDSIACERTPPTKVECTAVN
ncbi:MAG TPA: hypothetical protein VMW56_11675 [Candidatus Margulisiibacteriota bacterium]|nr:hypothetical protein [Candidatus Margulisiibacteriota bacterium]